ncbi:phage major capsid protein [Sulfitobacter sp. S190]|uniref:phage major capsid protein n=1 Tax=Sulfitobacter sp. S190 TaxID=2867022 RepID=UPI0021A513BD|nr:phage major capsid protein [Sulfitobacter sp. S190]UWR22630.1 phage major capsid protein [Sulfitobacter sp. S190]
MTIKEIKEQRSAKIAEMTAIRDKAQGENRDLSGEERKRFDTLEGEVRGLNNRLTDAEKLAEFERLEAGGETVASGEERRSLARYSLSKAVAESRSGVLTGCEAEWHQELAKDRAEVRGVMVPTEIILGGETRALTVGGTGGNMVATDLAAMTDRRRAALRVEEMGATILRNLTGNLELPRLSASGSAGWGAEHTDATRSDTTLAKKAMGPKTVSAEYELSRRMLLQSNQALEPILRADLAYLLAQKLDSAGIRGGGANEPIGILADEDVLSLPGGVFDSDITADLIAALETDNVTGTTGFLTNPAVMNAARKTKDSDGHVIPLSELFHSERAESSTQVPGDLGVSNDKNALIYGEWASLYIGYWSGVDLMMNPYHSDVASKGGAILHAFLDTDVLVRHAEGFRFAEID